MLHRKSCMHTRALVVEGIRLLLFQFLPSSVLFSIHFMDALSAQNERKWMNSVLFSFFYNLLFFAKNIWYNLNEWILSLYDHRSFTYLQTQMEMQIESNAFSMRSSLISTFVELFSLYPFFVSSWTNWCLLYECRVSTWSWSQEEVCFGFHIV